MRHTTAQLKAKFDYIFFESSTLEGTNTSLLDDIQRNFPWKDIQELLKPGGGFYIDTHFPLPTEARNDNRFCYLPFPIKTLIRDVYCPYQNRFTPGITPNAGKPEM